MRYFYRWTSTPLRFGMSFASALIVGQILVQGWLLRRDGEPLGLLVPILVGGLVFLYPIALLVKTLMGETMFAVLGPHPAADRATVLGALRTGTDLGEDRLAPLLLEQAAVEEAASQARGNGPISRVIGVVAVGALGLAVVVLNARAGAAVVPLMVGGALWGGLTVWVAKKPRRSARTRHQARGFAEARVDRMIASAS